MSEGMMAGAPATAPGGMSRKALIAELVKVHGWTKDQTRPLAPMSEWPALIDAVVVERQEREREQAGLRTERSAETVVEWPDDEVWMRPTTDDGEDVDPDELMAELSAAQHPAVDPSNEHAMQHGLLIKDPSGTGTLDYIFDGHSGAGPSASERWMHCTASLGASREFLETLTPNQQEQYAKSGVAASQGTTAHAAAEVEALVILGNLTQEEADLTLLELSIMPESDGEAYDEEMAEYITEYVDLVRGYAQDRGDGNVIIEGRVTAVVPLTDLHEGEVYEITGSGDCIVLPNPADGDESTLVVADLKYGSGIEVDVDENPQVRIYALGALGLLADPETGMLTVQVDTVTYHIVQPRLGGIKTWSEPLSDLLQWRDEVLAPALTKALYGQREGATFQPGDSACQFCPARGGCAALAEQRLISAHELFDTIVESEFAQGPGSFPETTALTDTRLGELLAQITGLIDIHKDLKAETERRLYRGDKVPGWQLVNYTPPRKWKDGAEEAFTDVNTAWVRKLMTPTQTLKLAAAEKWDESAQKILADLIDAPPKRPVVAKVGDRRKTWEGRPPEAMFDDEGTE